MSRVLRPRFVLLFVTVLLLCATIKAQSNPGKIVFADDSGRILVINADGSGQTVLTSGGSILDDNPTFSPDGSKIAFDRNQGSSTHIHIMNADGTNVVAITSGAEIHDVDPSWSPDGTKLVFASSRSGQRRLEIWKVNVDGSGLVRLTTNVQLSTDGFGPVFSLDSGPSWSPDGSRIAFVSSRDGLTDTELYVMDADGSNPTRLTNNANDDRTPTWSPDSQRIAFYTNGGSAIGINIIDRSGTNQINITPNGFSPAWSPGTVRLVYVELDPSISFKPAIFTINTDGTSNFKVTNNSFGARAPAWAPDSSTPIPTFTISGQIKDGSGNPISGASLNLSSTFDRSTQSDGTGAYSFTGLPTGNYKIDISKSGYGFVPPSITFNNLTSNQTANFTAFVGFSISGQVTGLSGNSIVVTLTGSESRTVLTDFNGHYAFNILPAGGNYTVSINTPFWNISPNSVPFNNLAANQIANFNAVRATYMISGTITRLGNPKPGIKVELSDSTGNPPLTTTTDVNGQYSFANVTAGCRCIVRPVGANYLFSPQTRDYNPLDGNKTADFVALSVNHLLFSNASLTVVENTPSLQVSVVRGGNASGVGPITVDYTTTDGVAQAGSDYNAVSGTLNFPEGTYSQTITIPILNDHLREGPEQFSITLSNPTGEVDLGDVSTAFVTIADDEPRILTESNSDRAIALNATNLVAGPFSLTTWPNFSPDTATRISLFVEDLQFNQGTPTIVIDAVDAHQNHYQLPLEAVGISSFLPFKQLIVRLPATLSAGDLLITITANGQLSTTARITIKP